MSLEDGLLIRRVIRLAREWKSLFALDRISRAVFLGAFSGFPSTSPIELFIIAVGLEDPTLLGFIVSQTLQRPWVFAWSDMDCICQICDGASREWASKLTHTHHYHFGCWSLQQYESIPPHIVYLLGGMIGLSNNINYCTIGRKLKTRLLRARESNSIQFWADLVLLDNFDIPHCRGREERTGYVDGKDRRGAGAEDFSFEEKWTIRDTLPEPNDVQASVFDHNSTETDLAMASSDGVVFKINPTILANAS